MGRIRVAHCIETIASGGVERCRLMLAQGLDPGRYEQLIICTQALDDLPAKFQAAGCAVHEIGVFRRIWDVERYRRAVAVLKSFRPHIVHGGVYEGVATAAVAGRLARVPVIIGEETSDPDGRRPQGHMLFRALAGLTDHMVAVSPGVGRYLEQRLHLPSGKITTINNGAVEQPHATAAELDAIRATFRLSQNDRIIGSVGRLLDPHKRMSDLIRALPLLLRRFPDAKLLLVGDGPDRGMLEALAAELGVADRVGFAGYQPRTRPFFELMDVFALASASEAFGLVLVEAMFASLPVVATRVGGIPDVVSEGETGLLVPPRRPDELAQAISEVLADPVRSAAMGEAGQRRARSHFTADRYVADVDALYQRLLRQRGVA